MPGQINEAPFEYIKKIVLQRYGCDGLVFREDGNSEFPVLNMRGSDKLIVMPPFLGGHDLRTVLEWQDTGLQMISADDFVKETTGESEIPVFLTDGGCLPEKLICLEENKIKISFDLLGTIFYILSRTEEYCSPVRDSHDRFPSAASHALQNGYLHRPVVDELIEVLWSCVKHLWPGADRKTTLFQTILSHDVDVPFAETFSSPCRILRSFAGDIIKRKNPKRAFKRLVNWSLVKKGNFKKDTNYTFEKIMNISEKHGLRSAFYFKTGRSNTSYDNPYMIGHPYLRELLHDIFIRGHEIGLHPSYETYKDPERTKEEFKRLLDICKEENIIQEKWGGRQHYLRWEAPVTWRYWNEAGLSYDSSLGYADCVGFRCGTCHEFRVFDVQENRILELVERPLIVMEGTLFSRDYMKLSSEKAFESVVSLKQRCRKFKGNFTLLWHNSSFETKKMWDCYKMLLES